jgi:acyl-homoserine-lactone acylase
MPLIETGSFHDAVFTLGYVHAGDRLEQMVSMRLLAQGRLAEMLGPGALDVDRFMRSVELRRSAETLYRNASPRLKKTFEVYARGVNAYLYRYRDRLPMALAESGYRPEYWQPEDSALIFCLLNFGLAVNLREEVAALLLAEQVGSAQLAWLLPTYPDEPLPFAEAAKLDGLALGAQQAELAELERTANAIAELNMLGVAASNNWAIAAQRSRSGASLLANDTHLPLALPSAWNFVHIRSPRFNAAGVSIAGVPAVVAGYNGKLAWGMTMVMGDTQDVFLERLKQDGERLYYLADGQWLPTRERQETFFIKGQRPLRETFHQTRNGPLLNPALAGARQLPVQPPQIDSRLGLALRMPALDDDKSLDAFFDLAMAGDIEQAFEAAREIRATPLNLVFADARSIGWQVTGRYPNRRGGIGLLPSPGWDGHYDWDGYADPMLHPYDQDPPQGWLGTANQRSVPRGYGMQLSSSWYYPERAERIAELTGSGRHDSASLKHMQLDQQSPFVAKLQAMFSAPGMQQPLQQAIAALPPAQRAQAEEALRRLMAFDGQLRAESADAALYAAFLHESARQIFLDELGGEQSPAWRALVETANQSYSAQADHLLGRDDSPFWDDRSSAVVEDKPAILARSLAAAVALCEERLGPQRSAWQWGKLHRYHWRSDSSRSAALLPAGQRSQLEAISSYLDRGPYPAGGDHSTLNVSAYAWGQDFDTWLVPAMRLVVDLGAAEPMQAINSSGQSGNPASPHYADGIDAWRRGDYVSFPFRSENIDQVYGERRLLLIPGTR